MGRKAPEVHGHHGVAGQIHKGLAVLGIGGVLAALVNLRPLGDIGQQALFHAADAPGHGAVLGDSVAQAVAHHGVPIFLLVVRQELVNGGEGGGAVEVVGVDDGKGALHHVLAAGDGVAGTPGLGAALRHGVALGKLVKGLVDEGDVEIPLHPVADGLAEGLLQLRLDDEHNIPEACPPGVKQGKVDDDVALIVHGLDLLEPAEPASHAGGHDD